MVQRFSPIPTSLCLEALTPAQIQQSSASHALFPQGASVLRLKVLPTYAAWGLCPDAEPRMMRAIQDQAVLLVNGVILVKFWGRLSGLAISNARLADGAQLAEGCWYAPIDQREEIQAAFDRGERHFDCVEGALWAFIREVDERHSDGASVLRQAKTWATNLPAQLPLQIAGINRQTYRENRHEAF